LALPGLAAADPTAAGALTGGSEGSVLLLLFL
jgi:hypothetical protein